MTTERRHRRHPTELKLRLVESYLIGEGSLKSIAKTHDITHTLLMLWVDKYRRGELTDEIDYVERAREAEAKIAALERKVGQLTMELDVLKKCARLHLSAAIGCRSSLGPRHSRLPTPRRIRATTRPTPGQFMNADLSTPRGSLQISSFFFSRRLARVDSVRKWERVK